MARRAFADQQTFLSTHPRTIINVDSNVCRRRINLSTSSIIITMVTSSPSTCPPGTATRQDRPKKYLPSYHKITLCHGKFTSRRASHHHHCLNPPEQSSRSPHPPMMDHSMTETLQCDPRDSCYPRTPTSQRHLAHQDRVLIAQLPFPRFTAATPTQRQTLPALLLHRPFAPLAVPSALAASLGPFDPLRP